MKVKSMQNVKHTIKDLNDALVETMIQKGCPLQPGARLCNATLLVYENIVSKQCDINLCYMSNAKTNNQWMPESSNIGTMTFIVLAPATHFYSLEKETKEMKEENDAMDKAARQMFVMVQKCYGKPTWVRDPVHILIQDDTMDYFCEGLQHVVTLELTGIVAKLRLSDLYTHLVHHIEDSSKMNGMRCKWTLLINARGDTK
jgi:hypothetical protein